jgi:hypothetical protein
LGGGPEPGLGLGLGAGSPRARGPEGFFAPTGQAPGETARLMRPGEAAALEDQAFAGSPRGRGRGGAAGGGRAAGQRQGGGAFFVAPTGKAPGEMIRVGGGGGGGGAGVGSVSGPVVDGDASAGSSEFVLPVVPTQVSLKRLLDESPWLQFTSECQRC